MANATGGDSETASRDELFDIMSNHRRRYAIHFCRQQEGPVTLSDLAEQVAAWEHDKTIAELTSAERKRVYTSLQQTHLPRLDDAGLIRYDDGDITLTDRSEAVEFYLDVVPENSVPWGVYYLGLSVIAALVLGLAWVGVLPSNPPPMGFYGFLAVLAFAVSAVYHTYINRRYRLDNFEKPP